MRFLKNVKFLARLLELKVSGRRLPISVIFNVTNSCNSQCKHCYASYYRRDKSGEITTEQARKLILELYKNGCQRVSFAGGEPLLRNDIGELINYVYSLGMSSTLNSNGILVPQFLEDLKKLDSLAISLDGRPEHHDIFRGKGSGEKALKGIMKAVEAGIRVHSNTVLHKHNLDDVDYMLGLAKKNGFKAEFNLIISNIFGDGAPASELKPTNEDFRKVLRYLIQKKNEGEPVLFSSAAYRSVLNVWEDFEVEGVMNAPAPKGMPECPAGKFFCFIDADGTLWACPHLIGKIESRNVLEVGIAEAWRVATEHPCTGCYQVYHHEFSMLMNLKPKILWNYFKTSIGRN